MNCKVNNYASSNKIYDVILLLNSLQCLFLCIMIHAPTTIYSASAGSGKTYTLARDYLTLLFKHPYNDGYRSILAVTFTNKAVAEMKERIVDYLHAFTKETIPPKLQGIYNHIQQETGLDDTRMRGKSQAIHNKLLHDYAAFDIVTIDAFSHRILRTFAKDLNLPDGFEVSMDTADLLDKAVYRVIARAGLDRELTKTLISFSLEKIDDGRSWDIAFDLQKIAQLLKNENHYNYLQHFKDKQVGDFVRFRESVLNNIQTATNNLQIEAAKLVGLCAAQDIQVHDFWGGKSSSKFNDVVKIANDNFAYNGTSSGINFLLAGTFYSNALSQAKKDAIDSIKEPILAFCGLFNENIGHILFHKNILRNLIPLSLLNELSRELDRIKKEERIVPIFEFNGLLQNQIKDEPAPFIYERLGERYRHYFIDEFQDTSTMQWSNLQPLIDNAVVQERLDGTRGSLMLVGDAKQSIYRWRGGDADQFLDVLESDTLFGLPINKQPLPKNYRSTDVVVTFNNDFFKLYSGELQSAVYKNLYENYLHQQVNDIPDGYVHIDFLDPQDDDTASSSQYDPERPDEEETDTLYPPHVLRQVQTILEDGYNPGHICVLVRTHKQGNEIAKYLIKNNIEVVSGESLQVAISPKVQLLERFMLLTLKADQQEPRYQFLMAYAVLHPQEDIQSFLQTCMPLSVPKLLEKLFNAQAGTIAFAYEKYGLFEASQIIASTMELFQEMDTRLQTFLEFIYSFSNRFEASLHSFIEYWNTKKDTLSVPATANPSAVKVMTIHKAKGLEFTVVIVPYCDTKLDSSHDATAWIPIDPDYYAGFSYGYMSLKSDNTHYQPQGKNTCDIHAIYKEHLAKTQMDHINTLYVAFTRSAKKLYILCKKKQGNGATKTYATLLDSYVKNTGVILKEGIGFSTASFGHSLRKSLDDVEDNPTITAIKDYQLSFNTQRVSISTRKGLLWANGADLAIHKGNVLHGYLAQIHYRTELPAIAHSIKQDMSLQEDEKQEIIDLLTTLLSMEHFGKYFVASYKVLNEQPILMPGGTKFIPDRLLLAGNEVTIIDYKTGSQMPDHKTQVESYAFTLTTMGYHVAQKVLIYTDKMKELCWQ